MKEFIPMAVVTAGSSRERSSNRAILRALWRYVVIIICVYSIALIYAPELHPQTNIKF